MMHRAAGDLFLERARRLETQRRLEERRRIEEALVRELQRQERAQEQARQQLQMQKKLEEEAASLARVKEEKERERQRMEQQSANMTAAFFRVLIGKETFPSRSDWTRFADDYCKTVEMILSKIGKETLTEAELFLLTHYLKMLHTSKTNDLTSLRSFLQGSYLRLRWDYFRSLLQGTDSCLDAWIPLF